MADYKKRLINMGAVENANMSRMTTFKIGGNADIFFEPSSADELIAALDIAKSGAIPLTVIGNGSNLLVSDLGIEGLVIRIGDAMSDIAQNGTRFTVLAGTAMSALARETVNRGFMGLEWAAGIPGRLGGAIAMNAGAYGFEMKSLITQVEYIENGKLCSCVPGDDDMGYRKSAFSAPGRIVVSAVLELTHDDGEARRRMLDMTEKRRNSQPLSYPSAGSVFKRPKGHFAGRLIEDSGLKGTSEGGAMVSTQHAGFIINTGNATCRDVLRLIELIKETVFKNTGIMLEQEIKFVGRTEKR